MQNNFFKILDICFKIQVLEGQNHLSSDPLWLFPKDKKSSQSSLELSISFTATFFHRSNNEAQPGAFLKDFFSVLKDFF